MNAEPIREGEGTATRSSGSSHPYRWIVALLETEGRDLVSSFPLHILCDVLLDRSLNLSDEGGRLVKEKLVQVLKFRSVTFTFSKHVCIRFINSLSHLHMDISTLLITIVILAVMELWTIHLMS
jgi:hypothetical protein